MTEPETKQPVPDIDELPAAADAATATEPEAAPAPEPEPWTPERVSEWNAYYDRYVMGAALLLALIVSCNYVADSSIFLHLRAGKLIGERSAPVTTDEFSYTEAGQRWVDVPWMFQWAHAALYDLVYGAVPIDPMDPTANRARADKIAMGVDRSARCAGEAGGGLGPAEDPPSRPGSVVVGDLRDAGRGHLLRSDQRLRAWRAWRRSRARASPPRLRRSCRRPGACSSWRSSS